ncbi:hypothetical protein [Nonomuraea typhae]|uniref:Delta-aminolevulinic acid dehydratase n=1 Tax=Nonomuraea typhae TaxID=2603600 RepID=A0ABW7YSL0_9ACTN
MSSGIGRRRPRRLRRTPALRGLAAEHQVSPGDLVLPLFVKEGITDPVPVPSMPGVVQHTAESAPAGGDRAGHQLSPANAREALREVALDLEEGADAVMVKPALGYLDVVRQVADAADVPVAAYQVSGEYAMLEAAAAHGWLDRRRAVAESLLSIRRAGADLVITYWALEAAEELLR